MAAKILEIIGTQPFELIRDRIGLILFEEMQNQFAMSYDEDLELSAVWVDRTNTFDVTDCPVINVSMADLQAPTKTTESSDETLRYNIDVYCAKQNAGNLSGTIIARKQAQRILGICRVILEDTRYNTLDFPKPSLRGVKVSSIQMADANAEDTQNISMGRLVLEVKAVPGLEFGTSVELAGSDTSVKIEETNLGLKYTYQA